MSGHSKFKNIMHKKEKSDAQRAKIFTKVGREIAVAVKEGGTADPNANSRLKDIIEKAKANNVPNDNIERILKKAAGATESDNYEAITYEGYGPCGAAVIVETLTDNRNRTAADMRHYFDKYGASLGQSGCVSWQFARKGVLVVEKDAMDEDTLMLMAMEAGASDISTEEEVYEIFTEVETLGKIRDELEANGVKFISAQEEMLPANCISIESEEDMKKMKKLLELLEDDDDVQNVWHNCDNVDEDDDEE